METTIAALPDDALAGVLRVLPPRSLAAARCVRRAWRDVVDGRALLRPHLLPRSVRGAFFNYVDHYRPHLFSRPSSSSTFPAIDGVMSFLPNHQTRRWWAVLDHCNGLVLCNVKCESQFCVCNPATRRWTLLPPPHPAEAAATNWRRNKRLNAYLAFDPAVSPHYEVFLIPDVQEKPTKPSVLAVKAEQMIDDGPFCLDWFFASPEGDLLSSSIIDDDPVEAPSPAQKQQPAAGDDDDPNRLMEWPPSAWSFKVFSSSTGRWEDRSFVREGPPVGTIQDARSDHRKRTWEGPRQRYAGYHHGWLYVHCQGSFVARFSLSNGKYQVIKIPTEAKGVVEESYLGRSQNGVYFGLVCDRQLRVWMLSELCGYMEWMLKYEVDIGLYIDYVASLPYHNGRQPDGSWMVEEDIYESSTCESGTESRESEECGSNSDTDDYNIETKSNHSIEWDSDNDDFFTVEAGGDIRDLDTFRILGFHPFKEVVFLFGWYGVACYHFNSSKIQYLGNSRPKCYYRSHANGMYESFIYTPCMIGDLLHRDSTEDEL